MLDLLWDLHQHRQIKQAGTTAQEAKDQVVSLDSRVERLERQVDRLTLLSLALCQLLRKHAGWTDADITAAMDEIDAKDGRVDGKVSAETGLAEPCVHCGRPVGRRNRTCLYCGKPNERPASVHQRIT